MRNEGGAGRLGTRMTVKTFAKRLYEEFSNHGVDDPCRIRSATTSSYSLFPVLVFPGQPDRLSAVRSRVGGANARFPRWRSRAPRGHVSHRPARQRSCKQAAAAIPRRSGLIIDGRQPERRLAVGADGGAGVAADVERLVGRKERRLGLLHAAGADRLSVDQQVDGPALAESFVCVLVVVTRQSRAGTGTRARSGSEASRERASRPSPD